jgi:hypothetical protein
MAAPVTTDEWLPVLTKRLDERQGRLSSLRSYSNGTAPLPEMGRKIRASWERFQKKARTNFGELIIEALAERLICNGVMVGSSPNDDDRARRIWRENRLDVAVADTIRDMLTVSIGYMVAGKDALTGRPVVTSEQPEFMYAATDPLRPWIARAAVKVWRDVDAGFDYAYVWVEGGRQKYERESSSVMGDAAKLLTVTTGNWTKAGALEEYDGLPPVVVFENHDCTGEYESHTDLLDRINLGILQRLVTVAMQAFRQRAMKGGLPPTGEDGKPIDYAALFAPAPGAMWDLPEGIEMWESQDSSQGIISMLNAVKDDIRDLGAVTRTPSAMLMPEGENQSAAGAEFAKEGLVMKAKDRIARITPSLNELLTLALKIEQPDFAEVVSVGFADPTHVSFAEKYDAAVKAKSADVPFRTRMVDILGFSQDEVDSMEIERAEEQLALATLTAPTPVVADAVA